MAKRDLAKLDDAALDEEIAALSNDLDAQRREKLHPLLDERRRRIETRVIEQTLATLSPEAQQELKARLIGADGITSGEAVGTPGRA